MVKFSVVIPAYNAGAFLERSLCSVQAQTYTQWEAIVVDDGSTDETWEKLQAFAALDERICIMHQKNMGQFFARQAGIKAATGDYVVFLDSDDELEPYCLSVIATTLEQDDHDMVLYTGKKFIDGVASDRILGDLGDTAKPLDVQWLKEKLLSGHALNALWSKAFRRSLLLGDRTDYASFLGVHCGEDRVQILYPLTNAKNVFYIPDRLYRYHFRSDSVMHRMQPEKIPVALAGEMFEMLWQFMRIWGMDDEEHREILDIYRLRIFIEVYFNTRKQCENAAQRWQLRRFPWKQHLDQATLRRIPSLQKSLTRRERVKLMAALLRL